MFGVQAIKLRAQRGTLNFIHQAPPRRPSLDDRLGPADFLRTLTYIAVAGETARDKYTTRNGICGFPRNQLNERATLAKVALTVSVFARVLYQATASAVPQNSIQRIGLQPLKNTGAESTLLGLSGAKRYFMALT